MPNHVRVAVVDIYPIFREGVVQALRKCRDITVVAEGATVKDAEQFAKDSRSALGHIRNASQGVFVILPRDQAPGINESSQLQKIVRVVSTVQYLLN